MKKIPNSEFPIILRTDFSDENIWKSICKETITPNPELGFTPYVEFFSDERFLKLPMEELVPSNLGDYNHTFIFIVDEVTISNVEHPLLCVDLFENSRQCFRVIPSAMWNVENCLSMANMDFEEFIAATETDGVFRGFK